MLATTCRCTIGRAARGPGSRVRVVSWNVNSIRARRDAVLAWTARHAPDVLCLQETKCRDDDFPYDEIEAIGYSVAHHGRDHWNGVAIASRVGLTDVRAGFPGPQAAPYDEARLLAATCGGLRVYSVYVPNGRELDDPHYLFKLVWLERLRGAVLADTAAPGALPVVLAGDFNVAPTDQDIYDPARWRRRTHASPPERAAIAALRDLGLRDVVRDLHPDEPCFTWWSYRPQMFPADRGLRIDLVLASEVVAARVCAASVDRDARAEPMASDHAPVVVDLRDEP